MSEGMTMPGGWTMSMAWMRMPGQTWINATAAFMGMWLVMMVAMMLPSLMPMLLSYRRALRTHDQARQALLSALVAAGYFLVWATLGSVAYPLGVGLAAAEMSWPTCARCVPVATGIVLVLAGCVQLTAWKARQLACCRGPSIAPGAPPDARKAWQHGIRLGIHCASCCSGLMMALLALGVMDLRIMIAIAFGITVERFAPMPARVARLTGACLIAAGLLVIARVGDRG